jgi:predicted AAA+ superfamily ATPase
VRTDKIGTAGQYIITGSRSFLINEKITQSLAGRVGLLSLLPFSNSELEHASLLGVNWNDAAFKGGYPRIFDAGIPPSDFYPSYINTYVERDIRQIKNIGDSFAFYRFVRLCAGRTGQLLNLSSLASDSGIAVNTAKAWLSVLEQSFVVFLLKPYHRNMNKRLVKSPKIYFYDTGLLCQLLNIQQPDQILTHYHKGAIFENLIILEILKSRLNKGINPLLWFWRTNHGNEIDLIIEKPEDRIDLVECKSGFSLSNDFLKEISSFKKNQSLQIEHSYVVYSGETERRMDETDILNWKNCKRIN